VRLLNEKPAASLDPRMMAAPAPQQPVLPGPSPVKGHWSAKVELDPITGLLAFPVFHQHWPDCFRDHLAAGRSVGIAVGDVDNLKHYVERSKTKDPRLFGHLAGNALMSDLGRVALEWFHEWNPPWAVLSTFGGDEIILACAGMERRDFKAGVQALCARHGERLPCTVSYAGGWFESGRDLPWKGESFFNNYVDALVLVDRALFRHKVHRKKTGGQRRITHLAPRWLKSPGWEARP
jgi:GGDEF domain-containing protein